VVPVQPSTFAFRNTDRNRYQALKSVANPYVQPKMKVVKPNTRTNSGLLTSSKRPKSSTLNEEIEKTPSAVISDQFSG